MKNALLLLVMTLSLPLHGVIIIVHGTWGQKGKWYQPQGDFYQALQQTTDEPIVPFGWVADNTPEARTRAAENLASLIMSYPPSVPLTLIGHSHGGNVINLASHLLLKTNEKPRINAVFSLATPVNNQYYTPNMEAIGHLYHFFSLNDNIQSVFGLFERIYAAHPRISNCRIVLPQGAPSHDEIHHPLIGKWLLTLIFAELPPSNILYFFPHEAPQWETEHDQQTTVLMHDKAVENALNNCVRKEKKHLSH